MALWDKLKIELDRAGKVAQQTFDEARIRLELHRARRTASEDASALGRAIFKAREAGGDLSGDEYARLANSLRISEADVARYEQMLATTASDASTTPPPPPAADPAQPV